MVSSTMDLEHQLLIYIVVIPQVILWFMVAVVLIYKFISKNHGVSILDEECPEPAIELEEHKLTPFGGRAVVNHKEEVFSISRTLGASGFVMEDILALSTTRAKPAIHSTHEASLSSNGCSLLEDVLAMRTMENATSNTCSLMESRKKESASSLSSLDNTRSSGEDVVGSDVNDSYPSVFRGTSSTSSSSPTSSPETRETSSRNRMTSTPRCPQELLKEAFVAVRTGCPTARKVLLQNMPSQIYTSEAAPSAIALSSDTYNISDQCSLVTSTTGSPNLQRGTISRTSFGNSVRTSFRRKNALLQDTLLQCGFQTSPVHSSLTKITSTYRKFDDCDTSSYLGKPEFCRVQRF